MDEEKDKTQENPAPAGAEKDQTPPPDGGIPKESEVVKKIREEYEAKANALQADYEKQLADKDAIILELLDGGKASQPSTIAEKINAKRNFKKY